MGIGMVVIMKGSKGRRRGRAKEGGGTPLHSLLFLFVFLLLLLVLLRNSLQFLILDEAHAVFASVGPSLAVAVLDHATTLSKEEAHFAVRGGNDLVHVAARDKEGAPTFISERVVSFAVSEMKAAVLRGGRDSRADGEPRSMHRDRNGTLEAAEDLR